MADIKEKAVELLVKNFPRLGKFIEDGVYKDIQGNSETSYNAATGVVTYATPTNQPFKAFFTKALGGTNLNSYPISKYSDLPPLEQDDLKVILPKGNLTFEFKNDCLIVYKSKTYRIIGVYNVSDVAYILFIRIIK